VQPVSAASHRGGDHMPRPSGRQDRCSRLAADRSLRPRADALRQRAVVASQ